MKIIYQGGFVDGVDVIDGGALIAEGVLPGVPLEVDDELGERLCEQDVWIDAASPEGKKAVKAAPAAVDATAAVKAAPTDATAEQATPGGAS